MNHVEDLRKSLNLLEEAYDIAKKDLEEQIHYSGSAISPLEMKTPDGGYILLGALTEIVRARAVLAQVPDDSSDESYEQCEVETDSWDHFTPDQMDFYKIRCSLSSIPHTDHHDKQTGLSWKSPL